MSCIFYAHLCNRLHESLIISADNEDEDSNDAALFVKLSGSLVAEITIGIRGLSGYLDLGDIDVFQYTLILS